MKNPESVWKKDSLVFQAASLTDGKTNNFFEDCYLLTCPHWAVVPTDSKYKRRIVWSCMQYVPHYIPSFQACTGSNIP